MRSLKIFLFLLFVSASAFAQIGAKAQQAKIFGLWQNNQFGYQMTLMLNQDGSGEFDGEAIKHSTTGNHLSITMNGAKTDYTYSLAGNSLTLSGGDLDGKVVFTRNGGTAETVTATAPSNTSSYSGTVTDLIGVWSGNGEMIEFKADGNCVYLGNTFPYQASQGRLTLTSGQGNVNFEYTVKGRILTLTANGQKVVYNKAMGTGNGAASGSGAGSGSVNAGGGVPRELVGQWCYMNMNTNSQTSRCINLNADGTYTYSAESSRSASTNEVYGGTNSQNSDRGTWYVQGDRIYYNSQSSGQGSYRLEKKNHPKNVNDPMIVLDGDAYVTTTSRAPWR